MDGGGRAPSLAIERVVGPAVVLTEALHHSLRKRKRPPLNEAAFSFLSHIIRGSQEAKWLSDAEILERPLALNRGCAGSGPGAPIAAGEDVQIG